jgi:hypothetical protein
VIPRTLHVTNGDSAVSGIKAVDATGDVLPWRDVLHEGPVPGRVSFEELTRIRAKFLSSEGAGDRENLERDLAARDRLLRAYTDYDEVVLWFEWDLYDQLQLIQVLDFLAHWAGRDASTTTLSLVCIEGYLGELPVERFVPLYEQRRRITPDLLTAARQAWAAFRADDPRELERVAKTENHPLEFLPGALLRQLEEFPSTLNGLSRSERQILDTLRSGPLTFVEVFGSCSKKEERIYCGDSTFARYIERMSLHPNPLLTRPSGDSIVAPATENDYKAFFNEPMILTQAGVAVLDAKRDWIEMGGSDRWIGGVHLDGRDARWRWNPDSQTLLQTLPETEA